MNSCASRGVLRSWMRHDGSSQVAGYLGSFQSNDRYRKQSLYKGMSDHLTPCKFSRTDLYSLILRRQMLLKKVGGILREQNRYAATCYNIGEHSPISGIRAGVDAFKQSGADIIVSVGGGSPIDASKAIIYFLHEQPGGEFFRQIAIPTTLSTAEYTV
jgi:iron-containing alcohol dehydrogenase-like protein